MKAKRLFYAYLLLASQACVIKVEVPASKTKLEKQISGEIVTSDEAVLLRAITRGEGKSEELKSLANHELLERELSWTKMAFRYLDIGYLGWIPSKGLDVVKSKQDDSEEFYEAVLLAGRIKEFTNEIIKRGEKSYLSESFRRELKTGWLILEGDKWMQYGVSK